MMRGLHDDLYLVVGMIDPQTKRATLRFHVNPLVSWVWIGVLVLMSGAAVSLWPEVRLREVGVWGYLRATAGAATSIMLAILFATSSARAAGPVAERGAPAASVEAPARPSPTFPPFAFGALGAVAVGAVVGARSGRLRERR